MPIFQPEFIMGDKNTTMLVAFESDRQATCYDHIKECLENRLLKLVKAESLKKAIQLSETHLQLNIEATSAEELADEIMWSDQMSALLTDLYNKCCDVPEATFKAYYEEQATEHVCSCTEEELRAINLAQYLERLANRFAQ